MSISSLSEEMKNELKAVVERLFNINFFDENRYNWLNEYIDEFSPPIGSNSIYIYLIGLISQKPHEYNDEYTDDIIIEESDDSEEENNVESNITTYSEEDFKIFKTEIKDMFKNDLENEEFIWLMANISRMPYNRKYKSVFTGERITDTDSQGLDRIWGFCKYGDDW